MALFLFLFCSCCSLKPLPENTFFLAFSCAFFDCLFKVPGVCRRPCPEASGALAFRPCRGGQGGQGQPKTKASFLVAAKSLQHEPYNYVVLDPFYVCATVRLSYQTPFPGVLPLKTREQFCEPFWDRFIQTKKRRAQSSQASKKSLGQSGRCHASRAPHSFLRCSSNASPTPAAQIASCGRSRCCHGQFFSSIPAALIASCGGSRLCHRQFFSSFFASDITQGRYMRKRVFSTSRAAKVSNSKFQVPL